MSRRRRFAAVLALALILSASSASFACTDIMVGKGASTDGSVITSHTADGYYDTRLRIVPRQQFAPGTMTPVWEWIIEGDRHPLKKLGEIPQVAETYQYINTGYPFMNEHQVIIGETTLGGRKETANSEKAIMTIEQLEVYALQRAKTAREAIRVIGDLAVKYGYRESCALGECLTISDPNEVWVFEVFGAGPFWSPESGKPGAVWAAQRVPDDHIACVPNMSRIAEIRPGAPDQMVCDNYLETAEDLGLYDPKSGEPFVWNHVFGDAHNSLTGMGSRYRLWRVHSTFAPSVKWDPMDAPDYPFSIAPEAKVSAQDVMKLFRDTYRGTQYDMTEERAWQAKGDKGWQKSPMATPQVDSTWRGLLDIDFYRPIARYYCSYFFVSQARSWLPDEIGGVAWFGLDNPEMSVFVPVYSGQTEVPPSWANVDRTKLDWNSAWWAFALVDDSVNRRYQSLMPKLEAVRDLLQQKFYDKQGEVEKRALELYKSDPKAALKVVSDYSQACMLESQQVYRGLVDQFLFELNNNWY
ncbi:MAG: dipeptidase [Chitinophagales bacterium]